MIPATGGKSKGFAGFVFEITDEVAEQAKFELSYLSVDKTTLEPDKSFMVSIFVSNTRGDREGIMMTPARIIKSGHWQN